MDRNLIAITWENAITIPLMAFIGLSVFALSYQLIKQKMTGSSGAASSTTGGY